MQRALRCVTKLPDRVLFKIRWMPANIRVLPLNFPSPFRPAQYSWQCNCLHDKPFCSPTQIGTVQALAGFHHGFFLLIIFRSIIVAGLMLGTPNKTRISVYPFGYTIGLFVRKGSKRQYHFMCVCMCLCGCSCTMDNIIAARISACSSLCALTAYLYIVLVDSRFRRPNTACTLITLAIPLYAPLTMDIKCMRRILYFSYFTFFSLLP